MAWAWQDYQDYQDLQDEQDEQDYPPPFSHVAPKRRTKDRGHAEGKFELHDASSTKAHFRTNFTGN